MSAILTLVKAVKDDSGHWYIIPNDLYDRFIRDCEDQNMIDTGEFDDAYGQYRTGGDLNLVQLFAEL